jgi:phosphate transport system substrate-binding protein
LTNAKDCNKSGLKNKMEKTSMHRYTRRSALSIRSIAMLMVLAVLTAASPLMAYTRQSTAYPVYVPESSLSGELSSMGSDTLVYLMSFWAVEFRHLHPAVAFRVVAPGSATAPPALAAGLSNFGPMSRRMKEEEISAFVAKYGYRPTEIRVGIDTLAVYINKDNPIQGLTLAQVDALFSAGRKCGYQQDVTRWGQLGLTGDWAQREVSLYGRNPLSGTRAFFSEHAMCKGEYKKSLKMLSTSVDVVQEVAGNSGGIGYSGVGYRKSGVRVLPLAAKAGMPYVEATPDKALSGEYPLTRYLYVYVNKDPSRPLPPLERDFLHLVLSQRGQELVANDGFIPLTADMVREELAKID